MKKVDGYGVYLHCYHAVCLDSAIFSLCLHYIRWDHIFRKNLASVYHFFCCFLFSIFSISTIWKTCFKNITVVFLGGNINTLALICTSSGTCPHMFSLVTFAHAHTHNHMQTDTSFGIYNHTHILSITPSLILSPTHRHRSTQAHADLHSHTDRDSHMPTYTYIQYAHTYIHTHMLLHTYSHAYTHRRTQAHICSPAVFASAQPAQPKAV